MFNSPHVIDLLISAVEDVILSLLWEFLELNCFISFCFFSGFEFIFGHLGSDTVRDERKREITEVCNTAPFVVILKFGLMLFGVFYMRAAEVGRTPTILTMIIREAHIVFWTIFSHCFKEKVQLNRSQLILLGRGAQENYF